MTFHSCMPFNTETFSVAIFNIINNKQNLTNKNDYLLLKNIFFVMLINIDVEKNGKSL
jgi:hypothetical protein